MNFIPMNGKIEIEPMENQTIILAEEKYEEMGKVVQVGEGVSWVKPGDIVFFLAWGIEQTPEYEGKIHYVLPANEKFLIAKYV